MKLLSLIKNLPADWAELLADEFSKIYFHQLSENLEHEFNAFNVFPPPEQMFSAFSFTPFQRVKVVILGQDPYHGFGQANGLCFSVSRGFQPPPSLKNIFRELQEDLGVEIPLHGDLSEWANQGVFLLNAILSVRSGLPGSHRGLGWENFTDAVIKKISENQSHIVFLLWGNFAQAKRNLIDATKHLILEAAHPSPLARGAFFGSRHFSRANEYLNAHGISPINWRIGDQ
jgi:uracil-DNA glycosylase